MDFSLALYDLTAQVLNIVLATALPALAALGVRYLNRRFRLSISEQQGKQAADLAFRAVMATSQKFRPERQNAGSGEEVALVNARKKDDAEWEKGDFISITKAGKL